MLRLACFLFLAKSAFTLDAFPVEYGSDGPVGSNTNLVYNFEQIRSDQPPQIELREENINKYRGRPRTTTLVPKVSRPVDDGDMSPMHPLPYNAMQWSELQKAPKYVGPVQNWKSVPAPPNFPHWESLSNQAVTNPKNYESQPGVPQEPIVQTPAQWSDPKMRSRVRGPSYEYMPADLTTVPPTFAPTMAPMLGPEARQMPAGRRGSQKFNWNDAISSEPSSTPASAPTPAPSRMPPPAVPTLSPWYDGF